MQRSGWQLGNVVVVTVAIDSSIALAIETTTIEARIKTTNALTTPSALCCLAILIDTYYYEPLFKCYLFIGKRSI